MRPTVDKTRTVPATPTNDAWPDDGYTTPGAVFVDEAGTYRPSLLFACPGCGRMGGIRAERQKPPASPSWAIQKGDPLKPETLTLSPSINCVGCCGWHGWLRDGVFVSC